MESKMLRRKTVSICAAAVAVACVSSPVFATELFWTTNNTGNFTDSANYTFTPPINPAGTNDFYDIGAGGTANFPGTGTLTSYDPSRIRVGHNLTNPGTGTLNVTSGSLTPGGSGGTGADGTTAGLVVGLNGDGILNQSGG